MAANLITIIPVVILYFVAQKYLIGGIASDGHEGMITSCQTASRALGGSTRRACLAASVPHRELRSAPVSDLEPFPVCHGTPFSDGGAWLYTYVTADEEGNTPRPGSTTSPRG